MDDWYRLIASQLRSGPAYSSRNPLTITSGPGWIQEARPATADEVAAYQLSRLVGSGL